jgi:hypothetical protein
MIKPRTEMVRPLERLRCRWKEHEPFETEREIWEG